MALHEKTREKMIVDWKNNKYSSLTLLGRAYKCSCSTASRIIGKTPKGANEKMIQMGAKFQQDLHLNRSPYEVQTIEDEVNSLINIEDLKREGERFAIATTVANMRGMAKKVDTGMKQVVLKGGKDESDTIDDIEIDFKDHQTIQETLDKGLITLGKADRHAPKGDVNVQQNNVEGGIKYQATLPMMGEDEPIDVEPIKEVV